ncbi:hypothetical protein J6590_090089 [Homalodisca vitripennis]|nr:hypothetical protein J6590_090089 [Homalodisca vitripennis]
MNFTVEKTNSGNPCIIFNNVKYRQLRTLRNGEISWRCLLGKKCGASIKTDADITRVSVCNVKHTGEHGVTMRSLLSPLTKPRAVAASSSSIPPASAAKTSAPSTPSTPVTPSAPVCSTPDPGLALTDTTPGPGEPISVASVLGTPEDPVAEVSRLKKEVTRLESEFKKLLDHTIESDSRLLEFTDQIFPVNNSNTLRVDRTARTSATVDRGVQCESEPSLSTRKDPAPDSLDFSAQCDLQSTACARCAENIDIICSQKTTIEVLQAENQYLNQQLTARKDADENSKQPWIKVTSKKKVSPAEKTHSQVFSVKNKKLPAHRQKRRKYPEISNSNLSSPNHPQNNNFNPRKKLQTSLTPIPHLRSITIRGDSHARYIAGLVGDMTGSPFSVGDVCIPGAGLLDIVSSGHTPSRPRTHYEVLIAGSNDLAVGKQRNIYSNLEAHIATRPANTELAVVTLPIRHDLAPDHPIQDETVLVNAYIEELAARYNIQVIDFNKIGRKHFTRHGQHLSMRGKRLMAEMVLGSLLELRPAPAGPRKPARPPHVTAPTAAAPPAIVPAPVAANGETADTPQHPPRHQHVTYAEAARGPCTPDGDGLKGRSLFLGTAPSSDGVV